MTPFVSIDQNSHPLWDTLPKLNALEAKGITGTHLLEDIDVAFTRQGAAPGDGGDLEIAAERYYRGGTSDWGATLFYTRILGRNPLDVRDLEPYTGMSTKALARLLDVTVDALYDRYSVSDNWQMIGGSYIDETRQAHRVIGDLTISETAEHIFSLVELARDDLWSTFPESAARERIKAFFDQETGRLTRIIGARPPDAPLVDLYRDWISAHTSTVRYGVTSERFAIDRPETRRDPLLRFFLNDYETACGLYNEAVTETGSALNKLSVTVGELPFFAVWRKNGAFFRTPMVIDNRSVIAGAHAWTLKETARGFELPVDEMIKAGVSGVAGKALLLVLQARSGPGGDALALPYRGSSYMPTARLLEKKLARANILSVPVKPVYRIKLNFPQSLRHAQTILQLPPHLARSFGVTEIRAADFAEQMETVSTQNQAALTACEQAEGRQALMRRLTPELEEEAAALDSRRKEVARNPETRHLAADLWDDVKRLRKRQWETFMDAVVTYVHTADLDYFNSRGAVYPWSLAIGGPAHYDHVISAAEIYEE
ncbi:MAG: hypothetical protein RRC34_06090 [Lentisphaeria bacterium]|nr:hypothetical protein [Lentisphaeria bacterium]